MHPSWHEDRKLPRQELRFELGCSFKSGEFRFAAWRIHNKNKRFLG